MKKNSLKSVGSTFIFAAAIIAAIFGSMNPGSKFISGFLLAISIGYLLGGWYYFEGYYPEGHFLLLFFTGYLYASVFISFTFVISEWPMAKTLIGFSFVWLAALITLILLIRKKLPGEGFIQFLIEAGLMLIMCLVFLF